MPTYKIILNVSVKCEEEEIDELVESIVQDIAEFGAVTDIYEGFIEEH